MSRPATSALVTALASLYLIWGSTYLAIAVAVEALPPLLMAGSRFLLAGGALYGVLRLLGAAAPARTTWRGGWTGGVFLLLGGNGTVCLVAHAVPSGAVALIIATMPLWMVLLPVLAGGTRPAAITWIGVALGLAGVAVLTTAGRGDAAQPWPVWGVLTLLGAAVSWAIGSLWIRRLPQPPSPLLASAQQMLCGGALMLVLGLLLGESAAVHPERIGLRHVLAFAWLVLAGSIAGFGAYVWLLRNASPALATSYPYVNPLVALLLGAALHVEPLGPGTGLAAMLIVAAVAATVWAATRAVVPAPQSGKDPRP